MGEQSDTSDNAMLNTKVYLHQTHHHIADFAAIKKYLEKILSANSPGLHILPELYLCGYPLKDLCLQRDFIFQYLELQKTIDSFCQGLPPAPDKGILLGGLEYQFGESRLPWHIYNSMFFLTPGKASKAVYRKRLLPNHDIFDEKKYFTPGEEVGWLHFAGQEIALLICQDMWPSLNGPVDPVEQLHNKSQERERKLDLIVNVSASPYHVGKVEQRIGRAQEISHLLKAPMIYVNRVGGEDEILFDGNSFAVSGSQCLANAKSFAPDVLTVELPAAVTKNSKVKVPTPTKSKGHTWESLFSPMLLEKNGSWHLRPLDDDNCKSILQAIIFGIQEYATKCNFNKFLVALSGGIDSALVLSIAKLTLEKMGGELEAIFMPSKYSSSESYQLTEQLCQNLQVKLATLPIKFLHSAISNTFCNPFDISLDGIPDQNVQSRLRGMLLYARSNQSGAMVLNTSNKSELAVGYSTLYGDSVGALSPIGDLYKSEVFQLADYINRHHQNIIPQEIITRGPTAELAPDQCDSDTLPPYSTLDPILEGILSYRLSVKELQDMGLPKQDILTAYQLYRKNEYKRHQFCPIIKVKPRSFGFGHREVLTDKLIENLKEGNNHE